MASRAARDMASCMKTGGKAKADAGTKAKPKNFMKAAVKPENKGKFTAKAKKAGKSTPAFAKEKASAPGVLGKEARLAQVFEKSKPQKLAAGGVAKARHAQSNSSGQQQRATSPLKSQAKSITAPKRPKPMI